MVAGGNGQRIQTDNCRKWKRRKLSREKVEFLDVIDALVEVCIPENPWSLICLLSVCFPLSFSRPY